jgi:hypothetical protein
MPPTPATRTFQVVSEKRILTKWNMPALQLHKGVNPSQITFTPSKTTDNEPEICQIMQGVAKALGPPADLL